jgi:outer membrane protein assembly factor BamA
VRCSLRPLASSSCVFVLLLAFQSSFIALAQTSAFEGRPIADIQFPNGQPLDPADLARVQPLKKGQALHAEDIARAIDGLFASGRFEDIVVEAEPAADGVIVRFVTQNAWFLGGIAVEGKVM